MLSLLQVGAPLAGFLMSQCNWSLYALFMLSGSMCLAGWVLLVFLANPEEIEPPEREMPSLLERLTPEEGQEEHVEAASLAECIGSTSPTRTTCSSPLWSVGSPDRALTWRRRLNAVPSRAST
jgi:hypothetical protein